MDLKIADFSKDLITKEQYEKVKEFNKDDDIIIRKANKSNISLIMDKQDYINKINVILSENSKFSKIDKDPSNIFKTQVNKLI